MSSISLCCFTAGPLHRVLAIFARYRPILDEIVCAVDARFTEEELSCLRPVADRIIPCEMGPDFLQDRYRPWLYGQCTSDWILTTDSDEVPSNALLDAIPRLADARDVVTYLTTVHWSYPDLEHWLDEYPWEPSWKLFMVRNDPATLYIKGGVHQGVQASEPYRYVDLPIFHLDCAVTSLDTRRAKVGFYDSLDGVQIAEDGLPVSERYYLPELFAHYPRGIATPEDLAAMEAVMAAQSEDDRVFDRQDRSGHGDLHPDTVRYEEIERWWPEHPFGEDAYRAGITLRLRARTPQRDLGQFEPGESRPIMVEVRNDGNEVWLRDGRNDISLSSRWFDNNNSSTPLEEGPRSTFTASVHPGDTFLHPLNVQAPSEPGQYRLVVDLVHEHVRWFDCGAEQPVNVRPPGQ